MWQTGGQSVQRRSGAQATNMSVIEVLRTHDVPSQRCASRRSTFHHAMPSHHTTRATNTVKPQRLVHRSTKSACGAIHNAARLALRGFLWRELSQLPVASSLPDPCLALAGIHASVEAPATSCYDSQTTQRCGLLGSPVLPQVCQCLDICNF